MKGVVSGICAFDPSRLLWSITESQSIIVRRPIDIVDLQPWQSCIWEITWVVSAERSFGGSKANCESESKLKLKCRRRWKNVHHGRVEKKEQTGNCQNDGGWKYRSGQSCPTKSLSSIAKSSKSARSEKAITQVNAPTSKQKICFGRRRYDSTMIIALGGSKLGWAAVWQKQTFPGA